MWFARLRCCMCGFFLQHPPLLFVATGVGNKLGEDPHPVAPVRRADGESRNNDRLDRVSSCLKVSAHPVERVPLALLAYVVSLSE